MPIDTIRLQLQQPMEWGKVEELVCELLASDDLPNLRKLGGVADCGVDGIDESFFEHGIITNTVVQITSDKAQTNKLAKTLKRLEEAKKSFSRLVVVYRQPVSSKTRTEMQERAAKKGVAVDVRDETYIVTQLSRQRAVYARYFGTPASQLSVMLEKDDPLSYATERTQRAVLAALGSYVSTPHGRLVRRTLYDNTVLAAIVSQPDGISLNELQANVATLIPEVKKDEMSQLNASIERLTKAKKIRRAGQNVCARTDVIEEVTFLLLQVHSAFDQLQKHVIDRAISSTRLDEASRGRLERNIRRAVASLFQADVTPRDAENFDDEFQKQLLDCLSEQLSEEVGRNALLALHEFVRDDSNSEVLAIFSRTYAAMHIRNIDPIGRAWQAKVLSRAKLVLDTDVILYILIEDLPESNATRKALQALSNEDVELVITDTVLAEVVGHLARAQKTYKKFRGQLFRMSPDMVDGRVWHALVRGYYYAYKANDSQISWDSYYSSYYRSKDSLEFVRFLLDRKLPFRVGDPGTVSDTDHSDIEQITSELLERKERGRIKAEFRSPEEMQTRVQEDVRMAVATAWRDPQKGTQARGYLVSLDRGFRRIERHPCWGSRPKIHVFTQYLPQLADFICGSLSLDNEAIIRLFFNPVVATAASLLRDEIDQLTSAGVEFHGHTLASIEWDLRTELETLIHADIEDEDEDPDILKTIGTAQLAATKGYSLDDEMQVVVDRWDELQAELSRERAARKDAEVAETKSGENIKRIAQAAVGQTKRGRSRVARVLEKMGIDIDDVLKDHEGA